ncbi:hypothetical protein SHELI_v1c01300 [Spiroplasma helicoides]|uniref:Uncharacterized protein n=1 Tax=Spiroplasma helicoides TaxID=216938 RepID=A0A1B3SJI0_9MOLU|nr:hypothetical protein [Spiroplasma helicoides]AOG60085.1 hypothetical protein SHELI_v1c01300 [Spiroplasma helicoides]
MIFNKLKKSFYLITALYFLVNVQFFGAFFTEIGQFIDKIQIFILIFLIISILIFLIVEFSKFIEKINLNINEIISFKWLVKRENIKDIYNFTSLLIPFVIFKSVTFVLNIALFQGDFSILFVFIGFTSLALILTLTSLVMIIVYISFLKANVKEFREHNLAIFLSNFDIEKRFINRKSLIQIKDGLDFEQTKSYSINIFGKNNQYILKIKSYFSILLNNNKKATTPPNSI